MSLKELKVYTKIWDIMYILKPFECKRLWFIYKKERLLVAVRNDLKRNIIFQFRMRMIHYNNKNVLNDALKLLDIDGIVH